MAWRKLVFEVASGLGNEKLNAAQEAGHLDLSHPVWTGLCVMSGPWEGNEMPALGFRLRETKAGERLSRPGPWVVMGEPDSYVADLPGQEYEEVLVFKCDYQPLEMSPAWEADRVVAVPSHVANEIGMQVPEEETLLT